MTRQEWEDAAMARYNIIVLSNPATGREAEFNAWYTNTHIMDLLKCPGVVSAQRFKAVEAHSPNAAQRYVAQYEVDTDDLDATMAEIQSRIGGPKMPMTDAFDSASAVFLVVAPVTEKIAADARVAAQ
jgi:hypothetical protein